MGRPTKEEVAARQNQTNPGTDANEATGTETGLQSPNAATNVESTHRKESGVESPVNTPVSNPTLDIESAKALLAQHGFKVTEAEEVEEEKLELTDEERHEQLTERFGEGYITMYRGTGKNREVAYWPKVVFDSIDGSKGDWHRQVVVPKEVQEMQSKKD